MQGKHILITGATNGIGLAAAQALAALGANVAIVGRNETRTRAAAAAIGAAAKAATATTFVADLSSQAAVRKLAAEVLARCPRLDVLVNNAGAMWRHSELLPPRVMQMMASNGPLSASRQASARASRWNWSQETGNARGGWR